MPMNTFTVATAVTPSVIETYIKHYLNRRPLREKPTAHISYHEGLRLIRQFLLFASKHTVEELQAFTSQWVPVPSWVRAQDFEVPLQFMEKAAGIMREQLGIYGLEKVGGDKWWQWRRPGSPLQAEWIEMKKDYNERKRLGRDCDRVILYVHGGAYFFGSVDEHRYQMQRHARKLKARVLAPRYRLAPQFPFPCGLYDCLAAYLYLLEQFDPSQILVAGDSAGGGMVLSMLVTLRDQGCPLPSGAILLSPWVDLTHSFPSVAGDDSGDYIPSHGFLHKPSMAWPPPAEAAERKWTSPAKQPSEAVELPAETPAAENPNASTGLKSNGAPSGAAPAPKQKPRTVPTNQTPGLGEKLEVDIDGRLVEIRDQVQLYARNELLTHPLVSPVQQPSLGGLPPMLIQVGGGELLRDEQIYLAHKAANPRAYPPSDAVLNEFDPKRTTLDKYPPTNVQLQVWEDLCHVPHTLSFTRPAKFMYRSVAQFGAWALAHAQQKDIDIRDDDDEISIISSNSDDKSEEDIAPGEISRKPTGSIGIDGVTSRQYKLYSTGTVGKAGDALPPFKNHMIRQRVNRHGLVFPLPPASQIESLHLDPDTIGAIKPGPVRKWLAKRAEHEHKFAGVYKKIQKRREHELGVGYDQPGDGQVPPPTAIFNRRRGGIAPEQKKRHTSWGLALWSGWGSSHDESTMQREEKVEQEKKEQRPGASADADAQSSPQHLAVPDNDGAARQQDESNARTPSPFRTVTDAGQADGSFARAATGAEASSAAGAVPENAPTSTVATATAEAGHESTASSEISSLIPSMTHPGKTAVKFEGSENTYVNPDSARPHNGVVAYPFKLGREVRSHSPNPSTITLESVTPSVALSSAAVIGKPSAPDDVVIGTSSPRLPQIDPVSPLESSGSLFPQSAIPR